MARRRLDATTLPTCDTSLARLPAADLAVCPTAYQLPQANIQYTQYCDSDACKRVLAAMKAANPTECHVPGFGGSANDFNLYSDFFGRIDTVCKSITPASAEPDATPSAPTTSSNGQATPTQTTKAPSKTTKPPTSSPGTTTTTTTASSDGSSSGKSDGSSPSAPTATKKPTTKAPTSAASSAGSAGSAAALPPPSAASEGPAGSNEAASQSAAGAPGAITSSSPSPGSKQIVTTTTTSSGTPTGAIAGIVVAAVVLVLAVIWFTRRKRKSSAPKHVDSGQYDQFDMTAPTTQGSTYALRSKVAVDEAKVLAALAPLARWRVDPAEISTHSLLGSGSQGAVYAVTLNKTRALASKRLPSDQLTEARLLGFVAEMQLVSTLQHPGIVAFVGVAWTSPYDVQALFEYMANGDLRSYLDRTRGEESSRLWGPLKWQIAIATVEGLVFTHSFDPPVVHRDLKARNILLDSEMKARISDFGVARLQSEDGTMTTGIGTSRWLAPEVIRSGGTYNEQCDVYSFGVVLYEMATHDVPFAGSENVPSELALLQRVATGELTLQVPPSCDETVAQLITDCVAWDPEHRPNALTLSYRLRQAVKP